MVESFLFDRTLVLVWSQSIQRNRHRNAFPAQMNMAYYEIENKKNKTN